MDTNLVNETITYVEEDDDVNEPLDFYRFDDPYSNEEFIIENRQFSGFNSYLPEWWESGSHGGLLFWRHPSATSQTRYLRPADDDFDGFQVAHGDPHDAGGDAGDPFPGESNNTALTPYTTPTTNSGQQGNGNFTGIAVTDISSTATNMTADLYIDYQPGPPQNLDISNPGEDGENPILVWDANAEPDLDHYLVWRGFTPNWKTTAVTWEQNPAANVTGTTWTDNTRVIDLDVLSATYYRLTAVDDADNESDYSHSTNTTSSPGYKRTAASLPEEFELHQNYPNPFNPETQIRFDLPERAHVTLTIYNLLGEEVRTLVDGVQDIGFHTIVWDGRNNRGYEVPSGVYLYRMQVETPSADTPAFSDFGRMTLLR